MVTRFLFHRTQYSSANRRVKPDAFMPRDGKTSVFRTADLTEDRIWELGDRIGAFRTPSLTANFRGDIQIKAFDDLPLGLEFDDCPPGHANISNWPEGKDEKKQLAIELANRANLVERKLSNH